MTDTANVNEENLVATLREHLSVSQPITSVEHLLGRSRRALCGAF